MCVCVFKNSSPEQELFSKGQARGCMRNKTDSVGLCQLLSAMQALQKNICCSQNLTFQNPTQSRCWSVSEQPFHSAVPNLLRGRNGGRRYCLIGTKPKRDNQNLTASSAVPSSSSATSHLRKVFSQCDSQASKRMPG